MKLLIFSLGIKGFLTIKALAETANVQSIFCIIGQDQAVADDYSNQLINYCQQQKIDFLLRKDFNTQTLQYDFALAIGWRWMLGNIPENKLIVFHDSLLPKYRGFAPLVGALINKETKTGVTALLGTEKYDQGKILMQKEMPLIYPTTIDIETKNIAHIYATLAVEVTSLINAGSMENLGYLQNEQEATYSLWRDEEDYRIDWEDDADNIEHFIRCVSAPYKGASALLNDLTIRIFDAKAVPDVMITNRTAGKVIFIDPEGPVIVCGKGLLVLRDVRDEDGQSLLPLKFFRSRFR